MLKMIIEAYSNHYILCKNQDILGKISAKAVESDFNEDYWSNWNTTPQHNKSLEFNLESAQLI